MKEAMLDFETFGNGKNALVVQVGACFFDRTNGNIGETFKMNVDAKSAQESGGEFDADTVYWWMQQHPLAIESILKSPALPIAEVFEGLNFFLSQAESIWSHATFDFVILTETLKRLRMKPKFSYRAARDIRTLKDLAGGIPAIERKGIHHDALDDAIYQAQYTSAMLQKLKGKL